MNRLRVANNGAPTHYIAISKIVNPFGSPLCEPGDVCECLNHRQCENRFGVQCIDNGLAVLRSPQTATHKSEVFIGGFPDTKAFQADFVIADTSDNEG